MLESFFERFRTTEAKIERQKKINQQLKQEIDLQAEKEKTAKLLSQLKQKRGGGGSR